MQKNIAIPVLLIAIGSAVFYFTNQINNPTPYTTENTSNTNVPTKIEDNQTMIAAKVDELIRTTKQANVIDITSCKPKPEGASIIMGSDVTFINKDDVFHVIWFSPSVQIPISAKSSTTTTFNFWQYPGIYDYRCDAVVKAGFLIIKKK